MQHEDKTIGRINDDTIDELKDLVFWNAPTLMQHFHTKIMVCRTWITSCEQEAVYQPPCVYNIVSFWRDSAHRLSQVRSVYTPIVRKYKLSPSAYRVFRKFITSTRARSLRWLTYSEWTWSLTLLGLSEFWYKDFLRLIIGVELLCLTNWAGNLKLKSGL
jgi:hypothetical protein